MAASHAHISSTRVRWLDRARGVALLWMIAGHSADAFLADAFRTGASWQIFDVGVGFVAPLFLLISGISLHLRVVRTPDLQRPLRRAAIVLLLGCWIQIPVLSLRQLIWNHRPDELARVFDVNILQAIALPTLVIIGLTALVRSVKRTRWIATATGILLISISPYTWHASSGMPLARFFGPQPDVTFPLAPFAAYLLLGFGLAPYIVRAGERRAGPFRIGLAAIATLAAAWLVSEISGGPVHGDFWHGSIGHSLFRSGGALLVLAIVMLVDRSARNRGLVLFAGRRSLAIYLLHLVVIYGSPMTMGLRYFSGGVLNRACGPVVTLLIATGVTAAVVLSIAWWERTRARDARITQALAAAWWILFAVLFAMIP